MAKTILIMGESGSGKTTSMRNLDLAGKAGAISITLKQRIIWLPAMQIRLLNVLRQLTPGVMISK